ncbi:hypothetical protein [Paraconexibacter sp.]|uniref:hypothetical protein n=1 Tax=Paraconexibacter sp. TaxID=2949640 RepID=UPI003566BFCD
MLTKNATAPAMPATQAQAQAATQIPISLVETPPTADAPACVQRTVAFFERHAADPHVAARLCRADSTVHIHVGDGCGVTLRLDRMPPEAEAGIVGSAEIEIDCTPAQLDAHVAGERTLGQEIMDRQVTYVGPVRKFLAISPILRGLSRGEGARARS